MDRIELDYSICPDCGGQIEKWDEEIYECQECFATYTIVKGEWVYTQEYKESIDENLSETDKLYDWEINQINDEIYLKQKFKRIGDD